MKIFKKIATVFILMIMIFSLTGCSKDNGEELKTKVISELDYINIKTVDMLNKLNNISYESYTVISEKVELSEAEKQNQSGKGDKNSSSGKQDESSGNTKGSQTEQEESNDKINTTNMVMDTELAKDRNTIEWSVIKNEIEQLNESWAIITLDLYTMNVASDTILDFSDKLNDTMIAIKSEDKQKSLTALANLYSKIPEFLKEINADKNMQKIRQTQNNVIKAYVLAEDIGNVKIRDYLTSANTTYAEVMSDIDYTKDKTQKTNKVYILLNELTNSVSKKDSDIFYIKYKDFMKEINDI